MKHALLKSRAAGQEKFNESQVRVEFQPGELVRFWNRVPARKGEGPSKLKLRNTVYKVVKMEGTLVHLEERETGKARIAYHGVVVMVPITVYRGLSGYSKLNTYGADQRKPAVSDKHRSPAL